MVGLPSAKKYEDAFIRFDRIHERDGQTDGHIRRHRMTASAALAYRAAKLWGLANFWGFDPFLT